MHSSPKHVRIARIVSQSDHLVIRCQVKVVAESHTVFFVHGAVVYCACKLVNLPVDMNEMKEVRP